MIFNGNYSEAHIFNSSYSDLSYSSDPHYYDNKFDNFVDDNPADF